MATKETKKKAAPAAAPAAELKKNIELHALRHEFYLAHNNDDDEGPLVCYTADPMTEAGRNDVVQNLAAFIVDEIANGHATNDEPVVVAVYAASLKRSKPFNLLSIEKAKGNDSAVSVRDGDGFIVEVLHYRSKDDEFPLIGVVFDDKDEITAHRLYSLSGVCQDGEPSHNLREYHDVKVVQPKSPTKK